LTSRGSISGWIMRLKAPIRAEANKGEEDCRAMEIDAGHYLEFRGTSCWWWPLERTWTSLSIALRRTHSRILSRQILNGFVADGKPIMHSDSTGRMWEN
jgi:hypothetical protein